MVMRQRCLVSAVIVVIANVPRNGKWQHCCANDVVSVYGYDCVVVVAGRSPGLGFPHIQYWGPFWDMHLVMLVDLAVGCHC